MVLQNQKTYFSIIKGFFNTSVSKIKRLLIDKDKKSTTQKDNPSLNETHKTSEEHANHIKNKLILGRKYELSAVVGGWGTGKSTIKNKLLKSDLVFNYSIVNFKALPFEEEGQITSQLYYEIARNLPCDIAQKFRACGILKKESHARGIAVDKLFFGGIIAVFIWLFFEKWWHIIIKPVLSYPTAVLSDITKVIILMVLTLLFTALFIYRDYFVGWICGIIPRKSHIELLEEVKQEFLRPKSNKPLLIFVDEMDRLPPDSLKLLFDELLIISETLNGHDDNGDDLYCRILMFFDEGVILEQLDKSKHISNPRYYLQKFVEIHYRVPRPSLMNEFYDDAFSEPFSGGFRDFVWTYIPSYNLLSYIENNLRSFRDFNRFKNFIIEYNEIIEFNNLASLDQLHSDITISNLFVNFRFGENLSLILITKVNEGAKNDLNEKYEIKDGVLKILNSSYKIPKEELEHKIKKIDDQIFSKNALLPEKSFDSSIMIMKEHNYAKF